MPCQIYFLISIPFLSAQMPLHLFIRKLKNRLNVWSDNVDVYHGSYSEEQLRNDLHRVHDTRAGLDEIHYQLLKDLPKCSLLILFKIFNKIWISGDFHSDWSKVFIITTPKSSKEPINPTYYRLIVLTSCICKTIKRMINRRLVWYLESHKLHSNVLCGFRSMRSMVDGNIRFKTFYTEASIHNQHLVSIFYIWERLCYHMEVLDYEGPPSLRPKRLPSGFHQ